MAVFVVHSHIRVLRCRRILHEKTAQSSNGVVANLEARAGDEDAEDEQFEDHTAEEDADEQEQDESEEDVCTSWLHASADSDLDLKGCRNNYGASITLFGFPASLFHSSLKNAQFTSYRNQNPTGRPATNRTISATQTPNKRKSISA